MQQTRGGEHGLKPTIGRVVLLVSTRSNFVQKSHSLPAALRPDFVCRLSS